MEDIAAEFAKRDRFLRAQREGQTYTERMERMIVLQQASWDLLCSNPAGYAHFMRRNMKKRAISVPKSVDAT